MATKLDIFKNADLDRRHVKNKILSYLNSHLEKKHRSPIYHPIIDPHDLDGMRGKGSDGYIICPKFTGTRSWIVFFHEDNHYYAVNFPKHSRMKQDVINIYPLDMEVDVNLYNGTIMEGVYYYFGEDKYLVVDEIYSLAGETQLLKSKDDRLNNLSNILKKSIKFVNNFHIYVSQMYDPTSKTSLTTLYDAIKSDEKIQEIIFYPKVFGKKIYSYTIVEMDLVDQIVKLSQFIVQKTDKPDVYKLIVPNTSAKIGIAYIPNIETSKKIKLWFNKKVTKRLARCQFDVNKQKWIPLEIVEEELRNGELD